jgi:hypothetical protein
MYGKTLEEDLKSELGGQFEQVAIALLMPRYEYDARNLRKAIKVSKFYNLSIYKLDILLNPIRESVQTKKQ